MKSRLNFLQLEDRLTPALSVMALSGGGLLITGTPEATSPGFSKGFNEQVTVTRIYASTYEVKDGGKPVGDGDHGVPGEYNIFGDLKLKFDGINNDVVVDLDGGPLTGNLSIDLGKGDIDTNTPNYITVIDGTVRGKVSFAGAQGNESIAVGIPLYNEVEDHYGDKEYTQGLVGQSPVTVEQGVTVSGQVTPSNSLRFSRNEFLLGEGSIVNGNVSTRGVDFNTIGGTVKGNVGVRVTDATTNSNLAVTGQVGINVTYDSAAIHSATIAGTVNGNVTLRGTGGYSALYVTGQVGNDANVESSGTATATISGTVMDDVTVRANQAAITIGGTGTVVDDARVFSTGSSADSNLTVAGKVGDAQVESSGAAKAVIGGTVTGDAIVRATKADLTVAATGTVGDDARVFAIGDSDDPSIYSVNLNVAGKVGDDVQVESSGRANATIGGTVMGDATVQASNADTVSRSVSAFLDVTGLVGQDVRVNVVGGGPVGTTIAGAVNWSVAVNSTNSTGVSLDVTASGRVGKDVTLDSTTDSGRVNVNLAGKVNRNVALRTVANVTDVDVSGQVVGALNITDGDGDLTVTISDPDLKAQAVINPGEGEYTLN